MIQNSAVQYRTWNSSSVVIPQSPMSSSLADSRKSLSGEEECRRCLGLIRSCPSRTLAQTRPAKQKQGEQRVVQLKGGREGECRGCLGSDMTLPIAYSGSNSTCKTA